VCSPNRAHSQAEEIAVTAPAQAEVRNWARSQQLTINGRGSLPAAVVQAYAAAHPTASKGTTVTPPAAKRTARKGPAKPTAKPAPASIVKARQAAPSAPKPLAAAPAAVTPPPAAAAGSVDLAGGLRVFLDQVGDEVKAVNTLSARIDELVHDLNGLREEQAIRLIVLDTLKKSVDDDTLSTFLGKAIRPRMPRVEEVIPERLTQA
jgi:hypothetical protein